MLLIEREIDIPSCNGGSVIDHLKRHVAENLSEKEVLVRFAVTQTSKDGYHCELGVLLDKKQSSRNCHDIFDFHPRKVENQDKFNAVMLVPTGIGAEIGGHAGDAAPAARLLASVCDTLVTHPNVVNASDINEMPANGLYVEGSAITDLLMGNTGLQKVRANRVILLIDAHKDSRISDSTINAVSAARASLGLNCPLVVEIDPPIKMRARFSNSGTAVGRVEGLERICSTLDKYKGEFDAIGLASVIDVPHEFHTEYFNQKGKMINPWGGVEAMLTHAITKLYGLPAAHSPMFESVDIANLDVGIVDPRMSAEAISACFLHCILKGLHSSPQIVSDRELFTRQDILTSKDISCIVIPDGCVGLPILAAMEQGIPVIAVKESKNCMKNKLSDYPFKKDRLVIVDNYLEAAGVMAALKSGVSLESVRRPILDTTVVREKFPKDSKENASKESFTDSQKSPI